MSKLIDDTEILKIGKKSFDVSNISAKRKIISKIAYSDTVKEMGKNEEYDMILLDDLIIHYGLYMIRQDFMVLARRMPFFKAVKSYIKRYLLSIRYIYSLDEKTGYSEFFDWAYFQVTGLKKKDLIEEDQIQTLLKIANQEIRKVAKTPEEQRTLLRTLLQESGGTTTK